MALLAVRDLTRRLGGIVAVDDVSFDVEAGEIVASGTPGQVRADPTVIEAYLGAQDDAARRGGAPGSPASPLLTGLREGDGGAA